MTPPKLWLLVGAALVVGSCSGEDESPTIGPWAATDAEYEFAVHDNAGTVDGLDEIAINRYESLLREVDPKCIGGRDDLVDQIRRGIEDGADEGLRVNVHDELQGISQEWTLTLQEREQLYAQRQQIDCGPIFGRAAEQEAQQS